MCYNIITVRERNPQRRRKEKEMKILVAGMKKEFVNSFIDGLKELGIKICGEPFETYGVWRVMYQPIGKEQKQKCEEYIGYRCHNDLM